MELFETISLNKKKSGVIAPKRFWMQLRKENELFNSSMQQDAQEFLNYLLNRISELEKINVHNSGYSGSSNESGIGSGSGDSVNASGISAGIVSSTGAAAGGAGGAPINGKGLKESGESSSKCEEKEKTWIQELFEGVLTNETRCLTCETVTTRDECFLDLSIDIEQNTSLSACLRNFSSTELLSSDSKFHCEKCCSKQEAQKRMRIKKSPNVLALHLKRFK